MTNKRWFYVVLLALVALALVACGGSAGESNNGADTDDGVEIEPTLPPPTLTPLVEMATTAPNIGRLPSVSTPIPSGGDGGDEDMPEPVVYEATDGTAESLANAWLAIYALDPEIPFELTTTDAEVEAVINAALAAGGFDENVQALDIVFAEDEISFAFELTLPSTDSAVEGAIVFAVTVDDEGMLAVEALSAQAGPLELPGETLGLLSGFLLDALTGALDEEVEVNIAFTDFVVGDGFITISGYMTE